MALWAAPAAGQSENVVSPQLWVDYNPSWRVTPRFEIYGDVGARTELESGGWRRFVVRPSVRYQLHRDVRLMGGLGNFVTVNDVIANRWEVRPWQGVNVTWPRAPVHFEHFLRFEEQFDFNTRTWESQSSLRGRYRLRTVIQWSALRQDRYWRLLASVEGFLTLAGEQGQFREQFRFSVGVERSHRAGVRTRFDATWQREGRLFVEGSINDLFLRVRLFTSFGG
ncbi:MAG: DUF2490 domain-containing protein [Gemmatimonadetes bacterium]|nr:DUF2490 domain-containing protein [Gemmatimonadota bacterium]